MGILRKKFRKFKFTNGNLQEFLFLLLENSNPIRNTFFCFVYLKDCFNVVLHCSNFSFFNRKKIYIYIHIYIYIYKYIYIYIYILYNIIFIVLDKKKHN